MMCCFFSSILLVMTCPPFGFSPWSVSGKSIRSNAARFSMMTKIVVPDSPKRCTPTKACV